MNKCNDIKPVKTTSIVNTYENFREIISDKDTIYQIKDGKLKFDRTFSKNEKDFYNIRYSFSIEQTILPPSDRKKVLLCRNRDRTEFDTKKGYTYVFTKITVKTNVSYEFEIEFDIEKLTIETIKESLLIIDSKFESNLSNEQSNIILQKIKNIKPLQPINISEDNYLTFKENKYQVTNKLDGERSLIYCSDALYSIKKKVNYIGPSVNLESLLDTEFFKGKYYVFDCYIYRGNNISKESLSNRLKYANEIVKSNTLLIMKKFSSDLLEYSEELLKTLNKDENDGLIYTPEDPTKVLNIFKWKFPEKMSIDFRVKYDGEMSIKTDGVFKTTFFYNLCIYTDKNDSAPFKIKDGNASYKSDKKLIENGIYEFIYQGEFILLRQREDKTRPNYIKTANNVWKDIMHPFESYKLLDMFRPLYKYRKYHNRIKRDMITKFCKNKQVLDLGVGRGGDLFKYENAQTEKVFGVEPYETNYKDLQKRLVESVSEFKHKVKLITTTAQDTPTILENVGINGVDVVSSFFSLSFFFFPSKPEDLMNFVQTVSQTLKEDGLFIGTTIDGGETRKLLMSMPEKTFNFGDGFVKMNKDETITFEVKGTIVETQLESLVDFDRLVQQLKLVGIELDQTSFFESKDLPPNENILNGLYRKFVFKKNTLSVDIKNLCTEMNIYDLMSRTTDEKCIKMFDEYLKMSNKFDVFKIPIKHHYDIMNEFYNMKKFIHTYDSINLLKAYSLYGDRLNKSYVREKIPENAVLLSAYKKKENYPALRDQLVRTLGLFKNKIDYGSLNDGLMVSEQKDGLVRLIFNDYSKMKISPDEFKDHTDVVKILEYLK